MFSFGTKREPERTAVPGGHESPSGAFKPQTGLRSKCRVFSAARSQRFRRAGPDGLRHPASASCLGRHSHPAGRCPNSSSLFRPLAALVAVALGCFCAVFSDVAAAVRIHPRLWPQRSYIRKTPVYFYTSVFLVGAGGFEPPKLKAADLQSVPIGHSGTRPYSLFAVLRTACIYYHRFSSLSIFFVQIFRFLRCPAGSTPAPVLLARLFAYRSFVWLPAAFPCMDRRWRVPSFGPSAGPSFPALQQKTLRNQRS